jgi:hypothetical protein
VVKLELRESPFKKIKDQRTQNESKIKSTKIQSKGDFAPYCRGLKRGEIRIKGIPF